MIISPGFFEWLLENVLQKEAGQDKYTLSPAAREKYSLTEINGEELEQALNDFLGTELFPERREMIFGRRKNPVLPSREVWNALAKLYDYWGTEAQRAQGLQAQKSLNGHKKLIQRDENSLREGAEKLNEKPIREEEIKEENEEIAKLKERISLLTRQIEYI
ncbi:31280_t:CDS:2 [Gigaspora margarita]|uniref:31280_t:CDS:1 n=1 Tax=Gigaspora margarita TaxID=4874 RepID=A0ABM8W1D4_GIGMA|nr:31280_t:CDS:2 [Gigaspora margarita]